MPLKTVATRLLDGVHVDAGRPVYTWVCDGAVEPGMYYRYMTQRANLSGSPGEALEQIAKDARIEGRDHSEALVSRRYRPGRKTPDNVKDFSRISAEVYA